jgi:hypothetical protein
MPLYLKLNYLTLTLRLEGGKGMEWNGKKKKNILRIFSHFRCLEV